MGTNTKIGWAHGMGEGATWNPFHGCRRCAPECEHCYAEITAGRNSRPGMLYDGIAKLVQLGDRSEARWTGEARVVYKHLLDPLKWRRPRMIFVDSMSDLFYEGFTFEQIAMVYGVMALADWHIYVVLTKRPRRAREFFAWLGDDYRRKINDAIATIDPVDDVRAAIMRSLKGRMPFSELLVDRAWPLPHVWTGTSAGSRETLDKNLLELLQVPSAVRVLSAEPLLEAIEIGLPGTLPADITGGSYRAVYEFLHWVIVGGESQEGARPCDTAWIQGVVDECAKWDTPCFVKQMGENAIHNGEPLHLDDHTHIGQWRDAGLESLCVQQYPKALAEAA